MIHGANARLSSLDYLVEKIWDMLGLVKVYTKKRGAHPDLTDPICLRKGATIEVRSLEISSPSFSSLSGRMYATEYIGRWPPTFVTVLSGRFGLLGSS